MGVNNKPQPTHLYSMRQAIEEGFILDVLKNYTNYELYFKLSKAIEEDPALNKKKAARAIGRFVNFHPHNLAQKTEIVEFIDVNTIPNRSVVWSIGWHFATGRVDSSAHRLPGWRQEHPPGAAVNRKSRGTLGVPAGRRRPETYPAAIVPMVPA